MHTVTVGRTVGKAVDHFEVLFTLMGFLSYFCQWPFAYGEAVERIAQGRRGSKRGCRAGKTSVASGRVGGCYGRGGFGGGRIGCL